MNYLPKNLTLMPGVRQLANGKMYQNARYPSGKVVAVPYTPDPSAEPARMIPVPPPQLPKRRTLSVKTDAEKRRLMDVTFRRTGENKAEKLSYDQPNNGEAFLNLVLRPLSRSPDQGKTWIPLEHGFDHYYQQVRDE